MTDKEFVDLVRRMRAVQRVYFQYHAPSDLNRARALERKVDSELERRAAEEAPQQTTFF